MNALTLRLPEDAATTCPDSVVLSLREDAHYADPERATTYAVVTSEDHAVGGTMVIELPGWPSLPDALRAVADRLERRP